MNVINIRIKAKVSKVENIDKIIKKVREIEKKHGCQCTDFDVTIEKKSKLKASPIKNFGDRIEPYITRRSK